MKSCNIWNANSSSENILSASGEGCEFYYCYYYYYYNYYYY